MYINGCRTKAEGQKLLAKLREQGHVWVTTEDNRRLKIKHIDEDKDEVSGYCDVLTVLKQRLHIIFLTDNGLMVDHYRHVRGRPIYGVVVKSYENRRSSKEDR